ncbi:hypothetical protein MHL40_07695 [Pseudomonas luteola]|uniref:ArnT family glycosyltransferase n=1 Tax=Pseudomonas luteola TaxID=47886 RepID=UPI001EF4E329|nr:hypothetical protein [Pseudomonas luteola]MCG7372555.1 hypothetical protein [Pseudomonas luteola]
MSQGASHPLSPKMKFFIWCGLLLAFYLVTGLIGRGLWKADEPYSFGMTWNFLTSSDWIVPRVGADPFMEKPPLMYWTGAITAYLFLPWLSPPDGSRMAVLGWMLLTLWMLYRLTERISPGRGLVACLLLLGTMGMVQHAHLLIADIPQLTGAMLALAGLVGFSLEPTRYRRDRLLFGTGFGIALMSKGLLIPGVLGVTVCAAVLLQPRRYLTRSGFAWLGWALLASSPWLLVWPVLLWKTDEALFLEWFWVNNFGRFFGLSQRNSISAGAGSNLKELLGLSFPVGWVLLGAFVGGLWRSLRQQRLKADWSALREDSGRFMVWLYVAVFLLVIMTSAVFRSVYVLPLFPALALLVAGLPLPERFNRAGRLFAFILFSILGGYLWFGWWAIQSGHTNLIVSSLRRLVPVEVKLSPSPAWFVAALLLTGLWLITIVWRKRLEAAHVWFAGITLFWGLANTLWLPWVDLGRSYARPFEALEQSLPAQFDCLNTVNMGESERSMLHYYTGIKPVMVATPEQAQCQIQMLLDQQHHPIKVDEAHWQLIWQGRREGDRQERLRAFMKAP